MQKIRQTYFECWVKTRRPATFQIPLFAGLTCLNARVEEADKPANNPCYSRHHYFDLGICGFDRKVGPLLSSNFWLVAERHEV